jgi:putative oxidoreductase
MAAVIWFFRLIVAAFFLYVGARKLLGATMWVTIFEQIGAGQWFRYLTGLLQISGAILLMFPRTFLVGVSALASTIIGAIITWIFVLHEPRSAILPAIVSTILAAIAAAARGVGRAGADLRQARELFRSQGVQ